MIHHPDIFIRPRAVPAHAEIVPENLRSRRRLRRPAPILDVAQVDAGAGEIIRRAGKGRQLLLRLSRQIDVIGDDIRLLMTQGLDDPFPSRQRHVSTTFLFLFFTSWFHYSAFSPDGGGKIVRFNSIFRYNLLDYAVREVYAMNVQNALEHAEDIRRLMASFYRLTRVRMSFFTEQREEIIDYPSGQCAFCRRLRQDPEMNRRCQCCDQRAFDVTDRMEGVNIYDCHAGLTEAIVAFRTTAVPPAI